MLQTFEQGKKYTSNTGNVLISTANSNLDGTGTIGTLISSPATGNGTIVNTIVIKSQVINATGMVRLFLINDSDTKFLIQEIPVPGTAPSGVQQSFSAVIKTPIVLQPDYALGVSTENAEQFSVTASGVDFENCPCA